MEQIAVTCVALDAVCRTARDEDLDPEISKDRKGRLREHSAVGWRGARPFTAKWDLVRAACLSAAGSRGLPGAATLRASADSLCPTMDSGQRISFCTPSCDRMTDRK